MKDMRKQRNINAIERVIFPDDTSKFLHDHVKNSLKIAVEVKIVDKQFDKNLILMKNCTYPSVF